MVGTFILTLVLLGMAVYAQYRIPFHSSTTVQSWITRLLLGVTGVGVGFIWVARSQVAGEVPVLLAFLNGFAVVHVPAAFILFIKHWRRKETQQERIK